MNSRLAVLATFALSLTILPVAAGEPNPPTIETFGSAEVRIVPDLADLFFSVAVRNVDPVAARKEQAERAARVLAALHAAGVEDKDLQTSQVNVFTRYVQDKHGGDTADVSYHAVSQDITCTVRDMKRVGEVTTNVLLAGASGTSGAVLRTSDVRKLRDDARVQAARAAREKAVAIAAELGAKVGKPYLISEERQPGFSNNNLSMATGGAGGQEASQPTFAPGMISVTASVRAVFLLE